MQINKYRGQYARKPRLQVIHPLRADVHAVLRVTCQKLHKVTEVTFLGFLSKFKFYLGFIRD
jgi:hypothetical protein